MSAKQENEMISNEEAYLYDYWKLFLKRKKIFLAIFFAPVIIVIALSLIIPRYYRAESEIVLSEALVSRVPSEWTSPKIVSLIGNIDETNKSKIFSNYSDIIKNVIIFVPKNSSNKIGITIESKSINEIPRAIEDIFNYIKNIPQIKAEFKKIEEDIEAKAERSTMEMDFQISSLTEARAANKIFLNDISVMIKKKKLSTININPADLVRKDGDLALEIFSLQNARKEMTKKKELNLKTVAGVIGPPIITKQPSAAQLKQMFIVTCILSLLAAVFVVLLLDYIERMKARLKK